MNNYIQVDDLKKLLIEQGKTKQQSCWEIALACEQWPYVFGAAGALCTPSNRKARARSDHPTIVSKCQVLNGKKDYCNGCKWLPGGVNVRQYDCRGFTRWCAAQVGITINGAGATSQWNDENNWFARGEISTMPTDQLVVLFVRKDAKMEHTGWGLNQETVECSAGVQHFTKRNKKWTHWAIPKGLEGDQPMPIYHPTLRRGSKGPEVVELQTDLLALGYQLPKYGADGSYGSETVAAVKAFQSVHGLAVDGICGPATWAQIDADLGPVPVPVPGTYTVIIPGLTEEQAADLCSKYPDAKMEKESGV